ncbi:MAG TPA: lysophospholipid acyltransferase family protein [Candidatus Dormibacteraeota bacterium]|nr:lysophospholipid acyltransferase family protein [Candidatus Dormibacteraeota bacterium]
MSATTAGLNEWTRKKSWRRTRAVLQNTLLFPGLNSFAKLSITHRERFMQLPGGAIFIANHCSALDGAVMVEALPPRFRNRSLVVAAADSIFKRKWEAAVAQVSVNAFPIPRGGGARPYLDTLKGLLRQRWSVIIFPEGRLSVTGNIGSFRKGAAVLAIDAGAPMVPAYIDGMYEVLPRFRRRPKAGKVSIVFGDPLIPQAGEDYDALTARAEAAVRGLGGEKGIPVDVSVPAGSGSAEGPNYWY